MNFILQHDNELKHTSKSTNEWFNKSRSMFVNKLARAQTWIQLKSVGCLEAGCAQQMPFQFDESRMFSKKVGDNSTIKMDSICKCNQLSKTFWVSKIDFLSCVLKLYKILLATGFLITSIFYLLEVVPRSTNRYQTALREKSGLPPRSYRI